MIFTLIWRLFFLEYVLIVGVEIVLPHVNNFLILSVSVYLGRTQLTMSCC